jgi:hypothetical protein
MGVRRFSLRAGRAVFCFLCCFRARRDLCQGLARPGAWVRRAACRGFCPQPASGRISRRIRSAAKARMPNIRWHITLALAAHPHRAAPAPWPADTAPADPRRPPRGRPRGRPETRPGSDSKSAPTVDASPAEDRFAVPGQETELLEEDAEKASTSKKLSTACGGIAPRIYGVETRF